MIHFIWSSKYPLIPGTGGSEVYTIGHARELKRRGIDCDIITIGFGKRDGRNFFSDVKFRDMEPEDVAKLDGTCIFVSQAIDVKTKNQSYIIFHCPPPREDWEKAVYDRDSEGKKIITTSFAAAEMWAKFFGILRSEVSVVYPFADPAFGKLKRRRGKKPTILFAGRLTPDKGIYTILTAMHDARLDDYIFKFVKASAFTPEGKIIHKVLKAHPKVRLIEARTNPKQMARLLTGVDVLIMPTSGQLFMETFGMLSIEAQHAGCRVVASDIGGLPETNIGALDLIPSDNALALADGIVNAVNAGPVKQKARKEMTQFFTLEHSVNNLLKAIDYREE